MTTKVIHKNSGNKFDNVDPDQIAIGELALNFHESGPYLQCKDSNGDIRDLGGVYIGSTAPQNPLPGKFWLKPTGECFIYDPAGSWRTIGAAKGLAKVFEGDNGIKTRKSGETVTIELDLASNTRGLQLANGKLQLAESLAVDISGKAATAGDATKFGGLEPYQFLRSDAGTTFDGTKGNINIECVKNRKVVKGGYGKFPLAIRQSYTSGNAVGDAAIYFDISGKWATYFGLDGTTKDLFYGGGSVDKKHKIWHEGNDGDKSGLDADKLDGKEGAFYQNADNINDGKISADRLPDDLFNITTTELKLSNSEAKGTDNAIEVSDSDGLTSSINFGGGAYFANNVGIGTDAPNDKLEVNGNLRFTSAGQGINFNNFGSGDNVSSNLLDDYEEGKWSPLMDGGSYWTVTYDDVDTGGHYTKIGNRVFAEGRIHVESHGYPSDLSEEKIATLYRQISIKGLPFMPDTTRPYNTFFASFVEDDPLNDDYILDYGIFDWFGSAHNPYYELDLYIRRKSDHERVRLKTEFLTKQKFDFSFAFCFYTDE